ncbi:MAG TPA: TlpA disulfide reductase family protein [Bryobacteraceae bacterium]|nr:TlpA disulfide reductase family protein [Bryobacteraceae bacterium]
MPALRLLAILQTDCPTCRLITPYLNKLASNRTTVSAVSQDAEDATNEFVRQMEVRFPVRRDPGFELSKRFEVVTVPTLYVLDENDRIVRQEPGFDKTALNEIAALLGHPPVATPYDGAPASKPGCTSRHLETLTEDAPAAALDLHSPRGAQASLIELAGSDDLHEYCFRAFGDALPVVPPTKERVERMLHTAAHDPEEVIARIPPCYGEATLEKIAANAVMAGCRPEMMRVLIPLARAVADERFNAHGVQATTHFAAPLIIVNGPVRGELGFHSRQNVFSNVARANSTLGRALQLILLNLGGARPDGIDMSALGNPGKFSYCIAENEEESPWEPLHAEQGLARAQSAVTLFAAEAPHGVSEHNARSARGVLKAVSYALASVWSYRACLAYEAVVVLGPEHVKTIHHDGFSKQDVRDFLFENTGVPLRCYSDGEPGEGVAQRGMYKEISIDGEPCYQKFRSPEAIKIVVAGGTAGKFSAVLGSWAAGPRGSQMVTYPI